MSRIKLQMHKLESREVRLASRENFQFLVSDVDWSTAVLKGMINQTQVKVQDHEWTFVLHLGKHSMIKRIYCWTTFSIVLPFDFLTSIVSFSSLLELENIDFYFLYCLVMLERNNMYTWNGQSNRMRCKKFHFYSEFRAKWPCSFMIHLVK